MNFMVLILLGDTRYWLTEKQKIQNNAEYALFCKICRTAGFSTYCIFPKTLLAFYLLLYYIIRFGLCLICLGDTWKDGDRWT